MRSALLACLLLVAGASALPQDVVPSQERIVDRWVINSIAELIQWIVNRGYDPLWVPRHEFNEVIFEGLLEAKGWVEELSFTGISDIFINYVNYHPLIGRLDVDIEVRELSLGFRKYVADVVAGIYGGRLEIGGSLIVSRIRLVVDTILVVVPGPDVNILNINTRLTVGNINGSFAGTWQCRECIDSVDIGDRVNEHINDRIPAILYLFEVEIGVFMGEVIRFIANNRLSGFEVNN